MREVFITGTEVGFGVSAEGSRRGIRDLKSFLIQLKLDHATPNVPDLNCWGEETLRTATLHLQGLPCGGPLTNCLLKKQIHLYYWQGVLLKENGSGKPGSPEMVCWVGMGSQFTYPWGRVVLAAGPGQVP